MSRLGSVGPWADVSSVVLMWSMLMMLCSGGSGVVGAGVPELPEVGLVYAETGGAGTGADIGAETGAETGSATGADAADTGGGTGCVT